MVNSKARTNHVAVSKSDGGRHYDNAGHLDPEYMKRFFAGKAKILPLQRAFVEGSRADDDLAEGLGEQAVVAMTTGNDRAGDAFNSDVEEDSGGPFVITSAAREFASGTDESNIAEATREPFPIV
jgi:hypothetical protein